MKRFNIVFFGTPEFAVPCLDALGAAGHEVMLVVTQPDRPKGRGRKMAPPPVKTAALEHGFDLFQPPSVRDPSVTDRLGGLAPDFFVVVAYGGILPEALLSLPKNGAVNVHASLLPHYRGSAPIQWAIINGETRTGVTTMLLDRGMDTGDILLSSETPIHSGDTAATLHDRLAEMGASLLIDTLAAFASGAVNPTPQDHSMATYAPLLKKSDGRIDWDAPAGAIDAFIRGMNPWPGAFTFLGSRRLKLFLATPLETTSEAVPGTVVRGFADELRIAAGKGALSVTEIQGASGKKLPIRDFLQGCPMPPGTVLSSNPMDGSE